MDPVFQRLGDVTIQRLEKPKDNKSQAQVEEGAPEQCNGVDPAKRNTDIAGPSQKRFKFDLADVTLEKKINEENSAQNYSDNELSEYDSESDIESDGEETSSPKVAAEESSGFLEKFAEHPASQDEAAPETASGDTEDYDYDIKQKLKEMGEISFETVKKSDVKPKKTERASTENEVVVTPAKKSSKHNVVLVADTAFLFFSSKILCDLQLFFDRT